MRMNTTFLDLATVSVGLLIARLVVGLLMAAHGSQKFLGWFGGHGIAGTAGFLIGFLGGVGNLLARRPPMVAA